MYCDDRRHVWSGPLLGTSLTFTYDGPLLTSMTWSDPVLGTHNVHRDYDANLRLGCECLGSARTYAAGACAGGSDAVTYAYDNDGLFTAVGRSPWSMIPTTACCSHHAGLDVRRYRTERLRRAGVFC